MKRKADDLSGSTPKRSCKSTSTAAKVSFRARSASVRPSVVEDASSRSILTSTPEPSLLSTGEKHAASEDTPILVLSPHAAGTFRNDFTISRAASMEVVGTEVAPALLSQISPVGDIQGHSSSNHANIRMMTVSEHPTDDTAVEAARRRGDSLLSSTTLKEEEQAAQQNTLEMLNQKLSGARCVEDRCKGATDCSVFCALRELKNFHLRLEIPWKPYCHVLEWKANNFGKICRHIEASASASASSDHVDDDADTVIDKLLRRRRSHAHLEMLVALKKDLNITRRFYSSDAGRALSVWYAIITDFSAKFKEAAVKGLIENLQRSKLLGRKTASGKTLLHLAAQLGPSTLVRGLLDIGADAAAKDATGCTPLQLLRKSPQGHKRGDFQVKLKILGEHDRQSALGHSPSSTSSSGGQAASGTITRSQECPKSLSSTDVNSPHQPAIQGLQQELKEGADSASDMVRPNRPAGYRLPQDAEYSTHRGTASKGGRLLVTGGKTIPVLGSTMSTFPGQRDTLSAGTHSRLNPVAANTSASRSSNVVLPDVTSPTTIQDKAQPDRNSRRSSLPGGVTPPREIYPSTIGGAKKMIDPNTSVQEVIGSDEKVTTMATDRQDPTARCIEHQTCVIYQRIGEWQAEMRALVAQTQVCQAKIVSLAERIHKDLEKLKKTPSLETASELQSAPD